MKGILKALLQLAAILLLTALILPISGVFAQALPIPTSSYTGIPNPPVDQSGQEIVKNLVLSGLGYVKVITVVIGILFITIQGYRLVTASGEEETVTKARRGIVYILVAFVMISMSQDFARIFDMERANLLSSPQEILKRVHIFDKQVEIFITFIKYVIGSYAVLMLVISGFKMITAGGNEEETTKHRNSILYSLAGLLLIFVGDIAINKVFYKVNREVYSGITGVQPGVDPVEGVRQIVGVVNLIVSFVGPLAVLALIVGAIMYATAGGNDENMEKAKRLIFITILGIIMIFGAFALVSTVINGQLADVGAILE